MSSFLDDVWNDVKGAAQAVASVAKPAVQVVNAPFTLIPQFLAQKTGNAQLQSLSDIFSKSFAGFATAGVSPQFLEGISSGNFEQFRQQLIGAGKGAAIAGAGVGAQAALGGAAVLPAGQLAYSAVNNGKLDSKALFNTLDPSGSTFGDSLELQSIMSALGGAPKASGNPYVYSTGAGGGYSSGYDSSYIQGPPKTDWVFYGIMAAGAALILLNGGKGK